MTLGSEPSLTLAGTYCSSIPVHVCVLWATKAMASLQLLSALQSAFIL